MCFFSNVFFFFQVVLTRFVPIISEITISERKQFNQNIHGRWKQQRSPRNCTTIITKFKLLELQFFFNTISELRYSSFCNWWPHFVGLFLWQLTLNWTLKSVKFSHHLQLTTRWQPSYAQWILFCISVAEYL